MTLKSVDDDRMVPYHHLKDRTVAQDLGLFVVEGEHLVRRLLASSLRVHSVLMTDRRFAKGGWNIPPEATCYLADKSMLSQVVGYPFHRGVLALGHRTEPLHYSKSWSDLDQVTRLLVCPEINDVENLGGILRSAAGLGFAHVLLGPSCCDPWARRAIRTSMGTVFTLHLSRSLDLKSDLAQLHQNHGFQWHAAVLDAAAELLHQVKPPQKVGLLLGSEAHGLPEDWLALAHKQVTIPMALQTDSLNVNVAAGIFMHHYQQDG